MNQRTAIFQISADAKVLASVLKETAPGEVVTYERLSASIGRDVQKDARGVLQTARRSVLNENRMVFEAVIDVGLMRLKDEQIVGIGDKSRDHIRRTARKTVKSLFCVNYDQLSREQQVKHNTSLSMMGVIGELATNRSAAKLESKVAEAGHELPHAKAAIAALGSIV